MQKARDFRREAWQKLSGNWGTMIAITLVFSLISSVCAGLAYIYVGAIAEIVLIGPLTLGVTIANINLIRKGEVEFTSMFDGFKNFVSALCAYLLVVIFTFLWSLLFVIPGIIKSYSYSMTMYILADHPEMGANDARKASIRLMKGNKWRLFCLQFSFIGWILLSMLTFGILMIWISPYMKAAEAAFYNSLVAQTTETTEQPNQSEPLNPEVTKA